MAMITPPMDMIGAVIMKFSAIRVSISDLLHVVGAAGDQGSGAELVHVLG